MQKNNNRSLFITIIALITIVAGIGIYMDIEQNELMANQSNQHADVDDDFSIGLLQYTAHPSLDAIADGIIDTLAQNGYVNGDTVTLDFQNAQGDQSNLSSISNRFVANDANLMIGIATPAALSLANASSEIPIILGAITDPENVGLVESNEYPGGNITGVSDMTPIAQQLELIRELQPEADTLGIIYSSSEDNSILQGAMAEETAKNYGFEVVTRTVSSTNDVAQVSKQLVTEVDAIWTPNDNVIASAFPSLIENSNAARIPVYPAVDMMVAQGGLATLGLNQYEIGVETGKMVVQLIEGEIATASEPIRQAEKTDLIINYEAANLLDIPIPDSLQSEAIDSQELLEVE
jgi:putative ABC transport system substrate-binding protein